MSGKKRITVDEAAWQDAMRASRQLRDVRDDLPQMLEAVRRAQEEQASRDRTAMRERQEQLSAALAGLSESARKLEDDTSRRIGDTRAELLRRAAEADQRLRGEVRQQFEEQRREFGTALAAERADRQRETSDLRAEIASDRAVRSRVLDTARTAVADARILHDAIRETLPHERFAPGQLARLTSRLDLAEASVRSGVGETALAQAQELQMQLGELRAEVETRDAEWQASHLTAVAKLTFLTSQLTRSATIRVADEETGVASDLDVDFWSDGRLSELRAEADELMARVADESDPPSLAGLVDIAERAEAADQQLTEVIAEARTRQWAAQVRVNMAELVTDTLEAATGYQWEGDTAFAGDDQRRAFYTKLRHPDDSEIVIEVAPGEEGESCVIRVLSYETGTPDEAERTARARAVADSLRDKGLAGTPAAEEGEADRALTDFGEIRRRQAARSVPGRG